MIAADAAPAIDRLRHLLGCADALARAAADLLAGAPVDDARARARAAHLVEMAAEFTADAWETAAAVLADIERAERALAAPAGDDH